MSNPPHHSLILSTGNIMASGASVLRRPAVEKSNTELVNSLRENLSTARTAADAVDTTTWTHSDADGTLYIPAPAATEEGLAEDREEYDITVKLFYLPSTPTEARGPHTRAAVSQVLRALNTTRIDLLIASFPAITFDADDVLDVSSPETIAEWTATWGVLEELYDEGSIARLGIAEFGTQRLAQLLECTRVKPEVDQINVRDCCVVPRPLILFAKEAGLELLTHNDCTEVLAEETLRGLLEEFGFEGEAVSPRWVAKYTAVVRSRGVVENKGYIAMADLGE